MSAEPAAMHLRVGTTLGKTGLRVSRLGIGSGYGISAAAVEKAYHEYGINYLYPALPSKGGMRQAIRNLSATERDNLVVMLQSYDHFGFFVTRSLERQLRKGGLDYADVLLLGWFNRMPNNRIIDAALALKEKGRVRYLAMSGHHRPLFGELAQDPNCPIDIFMVRYNAAHRGAEQDIFPYLPAESRPGVITYTTTSWGRLLKARRLPKNERPLSATECYRFALTNPNVDLCLCGPSDENQLRGALQALDDGPLDEEEMERARRVGDYVHG